ncbi:MAG: hypothetical protein ACXWKN_16640, partial [Phenylobacterium sp.]
MGRKPSARLAPLLLAVVFASVSLHVAGARNAPDQPVADKAAQPAPAQAASTVDSITVTAPKVEQENLPALVNRFVADHSATSRIDQLSRWGAPL